MPRSSLAEAILLLPFLCVSIAQSQEPTALLVVAESSESPPPPQSLLVELRGLRLNGRPVSLGGSAANLVRAESSYEASASDGPADRLRANVQSALQFLSQGDHEAARRELAAVIRHAEEALDTLGRQEAAARDLLDACLFSVRTYLEAGLDEDARRETFRCRRLVPDLSPEAFRHPPEVRELLARVDAQMPTLQRTLRVESTPSACPIRINGRELGVTPYEARTPAGLYTLSVECPAQGTRPAMASRVHPLLLGSEPVTVDIDVHHDARLVTNDDLGVRLRYRSGADLRNNLWADAVRLGKSVHLPWVLLLSLDMGHRWRLDWIDIDERRVLASAWLPEGPSLRDVRRAVQAISERRSIDLGASDQETVEPWAPTAAPQHPTAIPREPEAVSSRGTHITGWVVAGLGVASLGAAWGAWATLGSKRDELAVADPMLMGFIEAQSALDRRRRSALGFTLAAGLLLTSAVPLLAPAGEEVPAWAWIVGGAGLAVGGIAIWQFLRASDCIDAGCTRQEQTWRGGLLGLAHALPLLALPIALLAKRRTTATVTAGVGTIGVAGSF